MSYPRSPNEMWRGEIEAEVISDERAFGRDYAHAAEAAVPPGCTIFGLDGKPCTVTYVFGRRFFKVTSERNPQPHWINPTAFVDEHGQPLWTLIERHDNRGDRR